MTRPRFTFSYTSAFIPPFGELWAIVLLFYIWCYLVHPGSVILRGNLPDPDDYMYLTQVLDWLNGQSWFDNVQHRLNPPAGVPIHFSRLTQLPMAISIWVLHRLGMSGLAAATLTAVIEPLALFAGLLLSLRWLAKSFMPANWSGVTAYVTLFCTGLTFMFQPGHVDHHGLVVLLVVLVLGFIAQALREPEDIRWSVIAGVLLAFGLTVALEILPWLLIISIWVGLRGVIKGGKTARSSLYFGQALYIASTTFLILTRPFATLLVPDILTYSIVYVILTAGIAISFASVACMTEASIKGRLILGIGMAAVLGLFFLHFFPQIISGPYGAMDPALAKIMFSSIGEAEPLSAQSVSWAETLLRVMGGLIALAVAARFLNRATADARWLWALIVVLLVVGLLLTIFYQYRFIGMMEVFSIIPLSALLQRGFAWVGRQLQGRKKVYAEIGLLLLVGPLPMVLLPAVVDGRSFNEGVLLFPVEESDQRFCDMHVLEHVLNDPKLYGDKPHIIMNMMGSGPELLFRTHHEILSAPFHMNVEGNIDSTTFFSTTDPTAAEAILRRHHTDLIVMCRLLPKIYLSRGSAPPRAATGKIEIPPTATFAERLMLGDIPKWLKRVSMPGLTNYVLFEVMPPMSYPAGKI